MTSNLTRTEGSVKNKSTASILDHVLANPALRTDVLTISAVNARAVVAPLRRAVRTAVGSIPSAPLVLIDVETDGGVVGRSYLFGYSQISLAALVAFTEELGRELVGQPVVPFERMRDADVRFRLLGWQGLVGMAVSGLDMAFWDILGQAAGQPVVGLLGGTPKPLRAYDSYGRIDLGNDERDLLASVAGGFSGIKIKLGGGSFEDDFETVKVVRQMIGEKTSLMVDYNQSLTLADAKKYIQSLAEFDLEWVEEPLPAEDLSGHAVVRSASPIPIQTGENWWFPRDMQKAIAVGACDFGMPDIMKIGGVTGWMMAAGQAQAASLPISNHVFIEASAHLLPVTPTAHWAEYLDFAGSILTEPLLPQHGTITARGPGLGLKWDEKAVSRYLM